MEVGFGQRQQVTCRTRGFKTMSDQAKAQNGSAGAKAKGNTRTNDQGKGGNSAKGYKFLVDGRSFETEHQRLTGLQIKAVAAVDVTFGLFLEEHGHGSDRQIADGDAVDFSQPGQESFYTAPPATYGWHRQAGAQAGMKALVGPARAISEGKLIA